MRDESTGAAITDALVAVVQTRDEMEATMLTCQYAKTPLIFEPATHGEGLFGRDMFQTTVN